MLSTNYVPGVPNWVDLATTDVDAAAAFYGAVFGWQFQSAGPDAGGYGLLTLDGKTVAAVAQGDVGWATALLAGGAPATGELLRVVPPAEADRFVMAILEEWKLGPAVPLVLSLPVPWSAPLTQAPSRRQLWSSSCPERASMRPRK